MNPWIVLKAPRFRRKHGRIPNHTTQREGHMKYWQMLVAAFVGGFVVTLAATTVTTAFAQMSSAYPFAQYASW
jgi:hypothetical protein